MSLGEIQLRNQDVHVIPEAERSLQTTSALGLRTEFWGDAKGEECFWAHPWQKPACRLCRQITEAIQVTKAFLEIVDSREMLHFLLIS